jgi:hypothetical protein
MTKTWLLNVLILFTCTLPSENRLVAQDPTDLAQRVETIKSEFSKQKMDLPKRMEAIANPTERAKRFSQEYLQLQVSTGKRLMELARQAPKDPASAEALMFVLSLGLYKEGQAPAVRLLTENHAETKGVGRSFTNLGYRDRGVCLKFARVVAERNPNHDDRARAYLTIGLHYTKDYNSGKLAEVDKAKALQEAKQAFETVIQHYADARYGPFRMGPIAKSQRAGLLNIDHLVPGEEAPDILAVDLDGKSFQLSDYRGKVVLLDFWAHW